MYFLGAGPIIAQFLGPGLPSLLSFLLPSEPLLSFFSPGRSHKYLYTDMGRRKIYKPPHF